MSQKPKAGPAAETRQPRKDSTPAAPTRMTPFVMFPKDGLKALALYATAFKDDFQVVEKIAHGAQLHRARFRVKGQDVLAMDGGPSFRFGEGLSFFVECKDQAEVDHIWDTLTSQGGKPSRCGWLTDAWGISWQIIPRAFIEFTSGPPHKAQAVFAAMMSMGKLDVAQLKKAYDAAKET